MSSWVTPTPPHTCLSMWAWDKRVGSLHSHQRCSCWIVSPPLLGSPGYAQSLSHAWCIVSAQQMLEWINEWTNTGQEPTCWPWSQESTPGSGVLLPPACAAVTCVWTGVWLCVWVHACSSSPPQIELLINRPMLTWQSLHFSTAVSIISQILLIWQNPKIKQSSPYPPISLPLSLSL